MPYLIICVSMRISTAFLTQYFFWLFHPCFDSRNEKKQAKNSKFLDIFITVFHQRKTKPDLIYFKIYNPDDKQNRPASIKSAAKLQEMLVNPSSPEYWKESKLIINSPRHKDLARHLGITSRRFTQLRILATWGFSTKIMFLRENQMSGWENLRNCLKRLLAAGFISLRLCFLF